MRRVFCSLKGSFLPIIALALAACGGGGGSSAPPTANADGGNDPAPPDTNEAPTIGGQPPGEVTVGNGYTFRPSVSDPDGDRLTFDIEHKPAWASFSSGTGELSGVPDDTDIGTYRNILISVTDGEHWEQLPAFRIEVIPGPIDGFTVSWIAPTANTDGSTLVDLAGYKVYMGMASGAYSAVIQIDNPGQTTYSFDQLAPGSYYVAVAAFNQSGAESERSEENSISI